MRRIKLYRYFQFLFLASTYIAAAQEQSLLIKPTVLPAHPLGIFTSRIDHQLANSATNKLTFQATYSSANVWLPQVTSIIPRDASSQQLLSAVIWHKRDSVYQGLPQNHDSTVFRADGVIRTFQFSFQYRIHKNHSLKVGVAGALLTSGSMPYSILTNDGFIEAFHSGIAGGEDPFARKHYGFDKAEIYFQDKHGKTLHIKNKTFWIPSIQISYFYQLQTDWLKAKKISSGGGLHIGLNTSRYNPSVNVGISAYINKIYPTKSGHIAFAIAGSVLRNKLVDWDTDFHLTTNRYLPAFESQVEYRKYLKNTCFWSVALNFLVSAPYNNSSEANSITPRGDRISSHWHLAYTHLYRNNQNWSLLFAYGKRWIIMAYINEDFKVNNAPDIQTGIGIQAPLVL